jgi:hypothetical protein
MSESRVAPYQLWIYQVGAVILVAGKIRVDAGGGPGIVIAGSFVILLGALLMLYVFAAKRGASRVAVGAVG